MIGVQTTVATEAQARAMARAALAQNLCACAQLERIDSLYRWKGDLCEDNEIRLLFKTVETRRPALEALIRAHHPYELPAIWSVRLDNVSPPYADWIAAQTAD
ncbi:uncharacterized protein involved in tolerance to divalent cations [Cereibacter ovatus]|uniref:Uncharacterized protein involved in tolerance to divalent cations n=1 Tax=Cereibacter ovatus TaxID=439529 RepID=A0A285CRM4_9RHOB|nr:divalent-cation tolerance protein CutA [Cereibacter ovatus]SNX70192.1 uncharacterized protein involved in tolerance to divalent cations [Cereibacter ovatus]